MGFYDEIAKDIQWELASNTDAYLKVVGGKLQLPNPKWLQFHLNFLDKVIEAIHAFRAGVLVGKDFDLDLIDKRVVKDPGEALSLLKDISSYPKFSVDIETSNLATDKTKNRLLSIGIAWSGTEGVAFMKECFYNTEFKEAFQRFITRVDKKFILHNGIFDKSRTMIIAGIELKIDEDTLLKHYCGINEHKGTHGLKALAQLYLGFPDWEKELDDWKRQYCRYNKIKLSNFQYDYFPQELLGMYNVVDCCATFQLDEVFDTLMRETAKPIYRKLIQASEYYSNMISRGMLLDVEYWNKLRSDLEAESERLYDELDQLMPGVLVTSPKQMLAWLTKEFPNDFIESTGAEALRTLAERHPEKEALQKILDFRKNSKYLKTYVYGLWDRKDFENIIHCEFKLHGTETGRLSSSNPNMQNIPRNSLIKNLFRAREGYQLLQLDYSQCELRVLAYVSQDEKLSQVYIDGRDLHSEMQAQVFKQDFDPHDKDQRMAAKIINFGIPYGRTAGGVASQLKVTTQVAKKYLTDWFNAAPKVLNYIEKCHKMAMNDEPYYTVFGRTRHYFLTNELKHHVKNQSVNFPISSTANDLTIHSLVAIGDWLKERKIDAHLVNTVHDSIILEVKPEVAQEVAEMCTKIMATIPAKYLPGLTIPFKADAELGTSYGDLSEPDWGGEEEEDEGNSN